jgi:glycosyltransferase involved in cell wall biosynthesis
MRILLVSLFLVEYAVELANALSENHQVTLVLTKDRITQTLGDQIESIISPNVSLTVLPYRFIKHPSTAWCVFLIFTTYFKFRPHVVHIQECTNPLNLVLLLFRFRALFTTVHDVDLHPGSENSRLTPFRHWCMKTLRTYCYGSIIVHGEKLKKLFLSRYTKKSRQHVHFVPHGGLFSFLSKDSPLIAEEPHSVLFFGRMEKYKGLSHLIETEPLVSKKIPDFKIIVAGQGGDLEDHKSHLLGNPHFEVHARYIPNSEVPILFGRAAAVVLPYVEASQSGIVAMAFAFGKPVIATDVGSLSEVVFNGKNGLLLPSGDAGIFADAIVSLLRNNLLREQMSRAAKTTADTLLSWNYVALLTERVYKSRYS